MNMLQYSIHFCGFLTLVGLRLMPNVLQGAWCSQGQHHVVACCWQLLNQVICTRISTISLVFLTQMRKKIFAGKRVCMLPFYPCPCLGQSIFVTVGSVIVLNQLISGSIMVRHMELILVLSLLLRVYYLMRCTYNALQGVIIISFDSTWPSLAGSLVFWQDL